jgi:hypothetical protein
MITLLKAAGAFLAVIVAFATVLACGQMIFDHVSPSLFALRYHLAGLVAGLVIGWWGWLGGFFRTFEHEMTHVVFALLTFRRPRRMLVTDDAGGHMAFEGSDNALVSFSPYFFPLTAVLLTGVRGLASDGVILPLSVLVIFFLGLHLCFITREIRTGQPDLIDFGYWFSLPVTAALLLLVWGLVFCNATWGVPGAARFLGHVVDGLQAVPVHWF